MNVGGNAPTHHRGMEAKTDVIFRTPIFASQKRIKLFYYDYGLTRSGTAGAVSNYFFIANGLFDPNITGGGHQPMGFDQMMLLYNQYTVVASKMSLTIYNTTASVAVRAGVYLSPDASSITDPSRLIENGLITTKVIPAINVAGYIKEFQLDCDVVKFFGRAKNVRELLDDGLLAGTSAVNPTEGVYYAVTAWDPFGASNYSTFFDVIIEYDAIFWEPRKLTVS
jgi:hypothetical protein